MNSVIRLIKCQVFKFYNQIIIKCALLFVLISSCGNHNTKSEIKITESSPYELLFNELKINGLTDTILVQNKTKVFGCGTAYVMHQEELAKNGLYKFYEQYGDILDNRDLLNKFENNNNVKILWIERGNEGELFQLEDSILHNNKNLEERLLAQKAFVVFNETPKTLDSLNITVTIEYRNSNTETQKSFELSKSKNWKIDSQTEHKLKISL